MLASLSILNCLLYYRLWLWFDTEQIPIATISSAYNFCTYPCPFCKIRKSDLRNLGIVRNQDLEETTTTCTWQLTEKTLLTRLVLLLPLIFTS
ncbi:hypothetical protein ACHWQZ_G009375 [Mnemiopsis leidyi]